MGQMCSQSTSTVVQVSFHKKWKRFWYEVSISGGACNCGVQSNNFNRTRQDTENRQVCREVPFVLRMLEYCMHPTYQITLALK